MHEISRTGIAGMLGGLVIVVLAAPRNRAPAASRRPYLSVPPGFDVERVAGPPLVDRPIVADFDEQGRLYVADSSGSNDKVEKQLEEAAPHRPARGHRRRRPVRQERRLRRPDDVPRRGRCGTTARSTSPRRRASGS